MYMYIYTYLCIYLSIYLSLSIYIYMHLTLRLEPGGEAAELVVHGALRGDRQREPAVARQPRPAL